MTEGTGPAGPDHNAFLMQEHRILREDIYKIFVDVRSLQRIFIVAIGLYAAWYFSQAGSLDIQLRIVAVWLPVFISAAFGENTRRLTGMIFIHADYIRKIEAHFSQSDDLPGWENYLSKVRDKSEDDKRSTYAVNIDKFFWVAMTIVLALFALWETLKLVL